MVAHAIAVTAWGKDLLKQPTKIEIIGSNLCRNETFEEPMRGDCQKF
jgi:hypothetical protein